MSRGKEGELMETKTDEATGAAAAASADAVSDNRFGPLSAGERERFLESGPGSDPACRWLSAVLFSLCNYDEAPHSEAGLRLLDMHDRHDRELVLSDRWRHALTITMAHEAWRGTHPARGMAIPGPVERMEPMTAYSYDTLIRFSMTRHDATDMLCSKRIGDPVGAMTACMDISHLAQGMVPSAPSNMYMIQHMALPIATHPFSPLQVIVNAVCYGAHGNGRRDRSGTTCAEGAEKLMISPLSGTMEYSGPDCDPRLMAMILSMDGFRTLAMGMGVKIMSMTVPGVHDMGFGEATDRLIGIFSGMGKNSPFNPIKPRATSWRLPLTSYDAMRQAAQSRRYEEVASCLNVSRRIPDLESSLCVDTMAAFADLDGLPAGGKDRLPDTYAMMAGRLNLRKTALLPTQGGSMDNWRDCPYGIIPDMADLAYAMTFPRPQKTDPTILHDLMSMLPLQRNHPPIDELTAVAGAGAWNWFAASLPLRDPILSDATLTLTETMIGFADWLINASKRLPKDTIGIMLIPAKVLEAFFEDLHQGMPYDFALQNLLSASYTGADRGRDPDFHGLMLTMPYDISENGTIDVSPTQDPMIMPGTTDPKGAIYPDVTMIP